MLKDAFQLFKEPIKYSGLLRTELLTEISSTTRSCWSQCFTVIQLL